MSIIRLFCSFQVMIILLCIYVFVCAVATFMEHKLGVVYAKMFIYNALWFEILHVLVVCNLIGILLQKKYLQIKGMPFFSYIAHLLLFCLEVLSRDILV
ncbi:hypothetical protein CQA53_04375 [Helicobacter didelphidarum]|uniref:Uncharacterized protein n=1 Tax=Helicobacter didelphidarum TaxID=2040648 RepID=A0A3D8IM46_9HELI|nr:hypothetical protein [Helicobacter didelphidarum]RDU66252.1 hypothetical protein CQA53_04375 [Helicobacter didelphidarum]